LSQHKEQQTIAGDGLWLHGCQKKNGRGDHITNNPMSGLILKTEREMNRRKLPPRGGGSRGRKRNKKKMGGGGNWEEKRFLATCQASVLSLWNTIRGILNQKQNT